VRRNVSQRIQRKAKQPSRNAYPEIDTKGLDPVRAEPPGAADCGLAAAPPAGRALVGALTDAPPCAFCASEASWPRVLTPVDAAADDDAGTAVPAPARACGAWAGAGVPIGPSCWVQGKAAPLVEGPIFFSVFSFSSDASTTTTEEDAPLMGSIRGRMSGRSPSPVAVSYRDRASSSSPLLSSSSPEIVSEGDGARGTPSMVC
jgi:hypothetical protein